MAQERWGQMRNNPTTFALLLAAALALVCPGCATLLSQDAEPFTLVVMPDTQNYADVVGIQGGPDSDLREYFLGQTEWIKEQADGLNIKMVAHAGDIVQNDHPGEWPIADAAFRTIDNVVPYIVCLGNHDIGRGAAQEHSDTSRATNLNTWFPPSRFESNPLYGYGGNLGGVSDNYYLLFRAGGMKFLIVALEFKPRDEALDWANDIVASHPKHRCIVVTHAYLNAEARRADCANYELAGNGGGGMWHKFVKRHENIFLVLCGHILGEARLASTGERGNTVHEVLADYQGMENGGDGYLRIMTFVPKEDTILVRTYSPARDDYLTGAKSEFALDYRMKKR